LSLAALFPGRCIVTISAVIPANPDPLSALVTADAGVSNSPRLTCRQTDALQVSSNWRREFSALIGDDFFLYSCPNR
jgi:hypothetical protein